MGAGITYSARPALGVDPASCSVCSGVLSTGVKRSVRSIYHLPTPALRLRIGGAVNLRTLYASM
jgi:hypothetical protein